MGNETEPATGTHILASTGGGSSQSGKSNRARDGYSRAREHRQGDKSEWEKKPSERRALTGLESAGGGTRTSQSRKRNQVSDGNSRPREHRQRDKSEWEKKRSERRALTNWRAERDGQVRMGKETERAKGTHQLEDADRGTSQSGKRKRASDEHSPPGEPRRKDKSEWKKKPVE
jgi:hypothetical protein